MESANKLELHYYFKDDSHEIDAVLRNKCEAELLAIIKESAEVLDIDVSLLSEAYREGGFREFWRFVGKNDKQIMVILMVSQIIISTAIQVYLQSDSTSQELEDESNRLNIEERKLSIEKLKRESKTQEQNDETIRDAAKAISSNLKITKRKSNFYSLLDKNETVDDIGFSVLDDNYIPANAEVKVQRKDFNKFILRTNKLKSVDDDEAMIEIISPVLNEENYQWKGLYEGAPISFKMLDTSFKESVFFENMQFQHGTILKCVLTKYRKLNEVGEVESDGYSVTTVIEKIDGESTYQTPKGKKHLHAKKFMAGQDDLFKEKDDEADG